MAAKRKRLTESRARSSSDWYKPFLASLGEWANIRDACGAAKISRQMAYKAKAKDPQFAAAWAEAEADAVDKLRKAAWERAETVSDSILTWLLRSHDPMYRETTRTEISGPDGEGITIRVIYDDKK